MNRFLLALALLTTLLACSDGNNDFVPVQEPAFLPIATATVEHPPAVGDISLLANDFDLADLGY